MESRSISYKQNTVGAGNLKLMWNMLVTLSRSDSGRGERNINNVFLTVVLPDLLRISRIFTSI